MEADETRILRGGIVGCGYAAGLHIASWRQVPEVEIVAACDADGRKAAQFAQLHGIARAFGDVRELLGKETVDFLDIAAPPEAHESLADLALAAGRPAIVESPIAPEEDTARRMIERARERDLLLAVHEGFRWRPWFADLRGAVARGRLGTISRIRFLIRKRLDLLRPGFERPDLYRRPRLIFMELGIHLVDMARALAGPIEAVRAHMERRDVRLAGEDTALAWLEHRRALSTIDITWSSGVPAVEEFSVEGDRGVFHGSGLFEARGETSVVYDCADGREEVPVDLERDAREACRETQRRFIAALRESVQPQNAAFDNLGTLLPALAAYRSADQGRTVRLTA